jgi:hypothetical protein
MSWKPSKKQDGFSSRERKVARKLNLNPVQNLYRENKRVKMEGKHDEDDDRETKRVF